MSSSSHPAVDVKYDFVPFNGTPGETYDKWERALLNAGARADDRGYSISDHLTGVDEGTAANPHPAAAGTADGRKSRQAQRKRQKKAYAMLTHMKMRGQIMNNHVGLREAMYQGVVCMGWNAQQAANRIASHL